MATETEDPAVVWCNYMLTLVAAVRDTKPRDPWRAMQDAILDVRAKVQE